MHSAAVAPGTAVAAAAAMLWPADQQQAELIQACLWQLTEPPLLWLPPTAAARVAQQHSRQQLSAGRPDTGNQDVAGCCLDL